MSFDMQSKLAIISFSLRVSHARRRGSNNSRGRSPPWPCLTMSSACCTLSRSGAERFASLDDAMVSSAEVMRAADIVRPFDSVSERRWEEAAESGLEGTPWPGARPFARFASTDGRA